MKNEQMCEKSLVQISHNEADGIKGVKDFIGMPHSYWTSNWDRYKMEFVSCRIRISKDIYISICLKVTI